MARSTGTTRRSARATSGRSSPSVRNMRQVFDKGFFMGGALASAMTVTKGKLPPKDYEPPQRRGATRRTGRAARYPAPDGTPSPSTSSPRSSRRATGHGDDQPSHVRVQTQVPRDLAEMWQWMCPAHVYEVGDADGEGTVEVKVTPSNCVQCGAISAKAGASRRPRAAPGPSTRSPDGGHRAVRHGRRRRRDPRARGRARRSQHAGRLDRRPRQGAGRRRAPDRSRERGRPPRRLLRAGLAQGAALRAAPSGCSRTATSAGSRCSGAARSSSRRVRRSAPRLLELHRRSLANGVPRVELIGPERLAELEPHAAGIAALHSPRPRSSTSRGSGGIRGRRAPGGRGAPARTRRRGPRAESRDDRDRDDGRRGRGRAGRRLRRAATPTGSGL